MVSLRPLRGETKVKTAANAEAEVHLLWTFAFIFDHLKAFSNSLKSLPQHILRLYPVLNITMQTLAWPGNINDNT